MVIGLLEVLTTNLLLSYNLQMEEVEVKENNQFCNTETFLPNPE